MLAAIASVWLCSLYTPPGEKVLNGVEGTRQLIARAEAVVWVNEQIRGESDPWFAWVRNEIASSRQH